MTLPWLVVVTGASRGLGKAMVDGMISSWLKERPLQLVLMARHPERLKVSEANFEALAAAQGPSSHPLQIQCEAVDMADLDMFESRVDAILDGLLKRDGPFGSSCSRCILLNNAGTLGRLGKLSSQSMREIKSSMDTNVTAGVWLSARFARFCQESPPLALPHAIVNVSSLCAREPYETWGMYCAGKAGREMAHRVMAKEHPASEIIFLNFSPGPLDTDMQREIRESEGCEPSTRAAFRQMYTSGGLVSAEDAARACLSMVQEATFENGAHFDYFQQVLEEREHERKQLQQQQQH
jgi:sepiapterin reductase